MTKLLPVLAFSTNDYAQAEKVLDLIALYKERKPSGYILLVAAPDTHAEQTRRLQIAAKVGFEHVGLLPVAWGKQAPNSKGEGINHLFKAAALHIPKHFKEAFVWLEPDSVPTNSRWLEKLNEAYNAQPKRYMGSIMGKEDAPKHFGRVGVYPVDCSQDIDKHFDGNTPFNIASGETLVARASKSKLFQVLNVATSEDLAKVRDDAVVVHGDKSGILLGSLLDKYAPKESEESPIVPTIAARQGRKAKAEVTA